MTIILIIFGVVFLMIACIFHFKLKKIAKNGIKTEGEIVDLVLKNNSRYASPVIRFQTIGNISITKVPDFYSLPGYPKRGNKVKVIYNPDDPNDFVVESSPVRVILFMVIGLLLIIIGGVLEWKHIEL